MRNKLAFRAALGAITLGVSAFSAQAWATASFGQNGPGTATLTFSNSLLTAMQNSGTAINADGFVYGDTSITIPNASAVLDDANVVTSVSAGAGPITVSMPNNFASSGGSVSFQNLSLQITDPTHIGVYADVSGSNGLASQTHMLLWNSTGLTAGSDTTVTLANKDTFQFTLSDLNLTDAGKSALTQGLGLNSIGSGADLFGGVGSYGSLTVSMKFYDNTLGGNTNPVPEPSTYALMLVGLGAVGWVARRRSK